VCQRGFSQQRREDSGFEEPSPDLSQAHDYAHTATSEQLVMAGEGVEGIGWVKPRE
jgi:hypothetical protein